MLANLVWDGGGAGDDALLELELLLLLLLLLLAVLCLVVFRVADDKELSFGAVCFVTDIRESVSPEAASLELSLLLLVLLEERGGGFWPETWGVGVLVGVLVGDAFPVLLDLRRPVVIG